MPMALWGKQMQPKNMLFIMSDEHRRDTLGCYGHGQVRTPNLDALAASGVRFTDAYTNCPICVPARASFATGRFVHQLGNWDNAMPYDGSVPSWGHRLRDNGNRVVSIGKLHFRSNEDNNGFDEEVMPLHVVDGVGDVLGMIREDAPPRVSALKLAADAGPGDSSYQRYDDAITTAAVAWLQQQAAAQNGKPWALFVSLVCPHFPLIARPEWYDLYPEAAVPMPTQYGRNERPTHPFITAMSEVAIYDKAFDEASIRRAIAAYFGMVSLLDDNIGKLMRALEATGLLAETRVIYTSDHGDNLGNRGLWGKSNMYEDSAGIPLIMAGPGIESGAVCHEPVSLVDGFPTILDCVGCPRPKDDLPGQSLFDIAQGRFKPRHVFSEYHASSSVTGAFMIRKGQFKYVYYAGMPSQLFDLETDPQEKRDLGTDPGYAGLVRDCEAALRSICDPDAVDRRAHADQAARIEAFGGREAVIARGSFGFSPAPGTEATYS
jgi:choline-sulfatase